MSAPAKHPQFYLESVFKLRGSNTLNLIITHLMLLISSTQHYCALHNTFDMSIIWQHGNIDIGGWTITG